MPGKSDGGIGSGAARKNACIKYKAARAKSRLEELAFGTFNVRTTAVSGVINGICDIHTLMGPRAAFLF